MTPHEVSGQNAIVRDGERGLEVSPSHMVPCALFSQAWEMVGGSAKLGSYKSRLGPTARSGLFCQQALYRKQRRQHSPTHLAGHLRRSQGLCSQRTNFHIERSQLCCLLGKQSILLRSRSIILIRTCLPIPLRLSARAASTRGHGTVKVTSSATPSPCLGVRVVTRNPLYTLCQQVLEVLNLPECSLRLQLPRLTASLSVLQTQATLSPHHCARPFGAPQARNAKARQHCNDVTPVFAGLRHCERGKRPSGDVLEWLRPYNAGI